MNPSFPARIPLVWRRSHRRLQVGLDPKRVIDMAPPQLPEALRLCDGSISVAEVVARTGVSLQILDAALRHGRELVPPRDAVAATVVGKGALAEAITSALAPHRVTNVANIDQGINTSFAVFATGAAAVPREFVRRCAFEGRTWVPVAVRPDGIDVGPLVFPRMRGCPMCEDFSSANDDDEHAWTSEQLARQTLTASPGESAFAGGLVASALTCLAQRQVSDLHGVVWGLTNSRLHRRELVPHESCPCATTSWPARAPSGRRTLNRRNTAAKR